MTSSNVINVPTRASLSFHEVSVPRFWLLAGLFRLPAEMLVVERHRMYWLDIIDLFIIRTLIFGKAWLRSALRSELSI